MQLAFVLLNFKAPKDVFSPLGRRFLSLPCLRYATDVSDYTLRMSGWLSVDVNLDFDITGAVDGINVC